MASRKKTYRQLQKENTKQLVLTTAYKMFAEKGYNKTTMRGLAQEAGVGLGTIFKHFPDKSSLLVEAYQEDIRRIIINALKSIPQNGIIKQLLHVTGNIYDFYAKSPDFSRTLISESLFLSGDAGNLLDKQLQLFLKDVAFLIQAAIERKELSEKIDILTATQVFAAFYFSILVMALKKPVFNTQEELGILEAMLTDYFYKNNR